MFSTFLKKIGRIFGNDEDSEEEENEKRKKQIPILLICEDIWKYMILPFLDVNEIMIVRVCNHTLNEYTRTNFIWREIAKHRFNPSFEMQSKNTSGSRLDLVETEIKNLWLISKKAQKISKQYIFKMKDKPLHTWARSLNLLTWKESNDPNIVYSIYKYYAMLTYQTIQLSSTKTATGFFHAFPLSLSDDYPEIIDGIVTIHDPEGIDRKIECTYVDRKMHGLVKLTPTPNLGIKIVEIPYDHGLRNGKETTIYFNGVITEMMYVNDIAHGKFVSMKPNGARFERIYVNGKREGVEKKIDKDGNLISMANYLNGQLHGKFMDIYPDGTRTEGMFINDKLDGPRRTMDKDGNLINEYIYSKGIKNGKFIDIHPNGTRTEGMFIHGDKTGPEKITYSDGSFESYEYFKDKKHGPFIIVKADGTKTEGMYDMDMPVGLETVTTKDGVVIETRINN